MWIMADCRCVQVFMFCVFTQIFLLCVAQNTHMKNVARGKPCGTSSLYRSSNTCSAALNGNTSIYFQENPPNCIHTAENDTSPFWWVDLGDGVTINMITIYGRIPWISRMALVNVSVDGIVVKRFTDESGWTNGSYTFRVLRGGRVVNITRKSDPNNPTLNICEVQVWECADGWYGTDCSQTCGNCITSSDCDKTTGRCTSCQARFSFPYCKDCERGWYGYNCVETCGHCMGGNSTCDKINGSCPSCYGAFTPPLCKDNPSSTPLMTTLNTSSSVPATATEYSSFAPTETVSVAGPVAGAAVGCAVVFFIIGAVFGWWLRKSRFQQPSANGSSPCGISMTSDTGTSRSTSRSDKKVDTTPDYTTNVYDALKARDDNNTTAYTSLNFHTDVHR